MRKQGKKYVEASSKVEKNKLYTCEEAIKLVKETNVTKFDGSIDIAIKLNIDASKSDQQLRGSIVLPAGSGKVKKILVIADGEEAKRATEAGADYVGADELINKIESENWFDYDVIVATPKMMAKLGKIGKVLGPKGLMPNPKTGTVTATPEKTIADIKKGMIEYKTDSYGNIHGIIGKSSFKEKDLLNNLTYFVKTITAAKPVAVKGEFVKSVAISSTMGPGIKIDKNSFDI